MKKIIPFLLLFIACNNNQTQKEVEKTKDKVKETSGLNDLTNYEVEHNPEKIALLSIIKEVPIDSVYMILNDYKSKFKGGFDVEDKMKVERVIDSISQFRHMSRKRIASLIFSFNYELITKDEIKEQIGNNSSEDDE